MATSSLRSTVNRPFPDSHLRPAQPNPMLLLEEGGTVRAGAVAKRLGVPVPMVEQLRHAGHVLAVQGQHGYTYPAWQFEGRGVLSGLPTVLRALGGDPGTQLLFLLTPNTALDGRRPLDLLREGAQDEVLRAVRATGEAPLS